MIPTRLLVPSSHISSNRPNSVFTVQSFEDSQDACSQSLGLRPVRFRRIGRTYKHTESQDLNSHSVHDQEDERLGQKRSHLN